MHLFKQLYIWNYKQIFNFIYFIDIEYRYNAISYIDIFLSSLCFQLIELFLRINHYNHRDIFIYIVRDTDKEEDNKKSYLSARTQGWMETRSLSSS